MSGMDEMLSVAEMLAAKMSHDLSSGIGVLPMLLEMAAETPGGEALPLATEIARNLVDRLKLLRAAWGPAGEPMDVPSLSALAAGLMQSRCRLDCSGVPDGTTFAPAVAKMLLNLVLLAAESLPQGGDIRVSGSGGDVVLTVTGQRAAWPQGLATCLSGREAAMLAMQDSRYRQMGFTVLLAQSQGFRLSLGNDGSPAPLRLTAG